jgi:hypothetical protein
MDVLQNRKRHIWEETITKHKDNDWCGTGLGSEIEGPCGEVTCNLMYRLGQALCPCRTNTRWPQVLTKCTVSVLLNTIRNGISAIKGMLRLIRERSSELVRVVCHTWGFVLQYGYQNGGNGILWCQQMLFSFINVYSRDTNSNSNTSFWTLKGNATNILVTTIHQRTHNGVSLSF